MLGIAGIQESRNQPGIDQVDKGECQNKTAQVQHHKSFTLPNRPPCPVIQPGVKPRRSRRRPVFQ